MGWLTRSVNGAFGMWLSKIRYRGRQHILRLHRTCPVTRRLAVSPAHPGQDRETRWCESVQASMVGWVRNPGCPPQGGLPPMDGVGGAVVEIACDESGFSGTNLLDSATPVFTHASVDLRVDEAAELIRALRSRLPWQLNELKSGQFLRGPQADE